MAKDAANNVTVILRVPLTHKDDLGSIRHWTNLKVAVAGDWCWVKDFTPAQQAAAELKILPFKTVFHLHGNQLFPEGSLLPLTNMPGGLLWTPVEKALPVTMPSLNHNFFGQEQSIAVRLLPAAQEHPPVALLAEMDALAGYIDTAPAIRLQSLAWVLLPPGRALLLGTPLLPVQGLAYWLYENMLLPAGYNFEWPLLAKSIAAMVDVSGSNWIVWQPDSNYFLVPKASLQPLSISSFRLSVRLAGSYSSSNT